MEAFAVPALLATLNASRPSVICLRFLSKLRGCGVHWRIMSTQSFPDIIDNAASCKNQLASSSITYAAAVCHIVCISIASSNSTWKAPYQRLILNLYAISIFFSPSSLYLSSRSSTPPFSLAKSLIAFRQISSHYQADGGLKFSCIAFAKFFCHFAICCTIRRSHMLW